MTDPFDPLPLLAWEDLSSGTKTLIRRHFSLYNTLEGVAEALMEPEFPERLVDLSLPVDPSTLPPSFMMRRNPSIDVEGFRRVRHRLWERNRFGPRGPKTPAQRKESSEHHVRIRKAVVEFELGGSPDELACEFCGSIDNIRGVIYGEIVKRKRLRGTIKRRKYVYVQEVDRWYWICSSCAVEMSSTKKML